MRTSAAAAGAAKAGNAETTGAPAAPSRKTRRSIRNTLQVRPGADKYRQSHANRAYRKMWTGNAVGACLHLRPRPTAFGARRLTRLRWCDSVVDQGKCAMVLSEFVA